MSDAAAAPAPGMPDMAASLDNFDAIVSSYDNAPAPELPANDGPDVAPELGDEPVEPEAPELEQDEFAQATELAAKARTWLEQEDLPEEFLSKRLVAKVDGEERVVTVQEAIEGYQRRAKGTQAMQEAAAVRQHAQSLITGQRQQHERWGADQSGKTLRTELEDMGYGAHLEQVAKQIFAEFAQEQRVLDAIQDPQAKQLAAQRFQEGRAHARQAREHARQAQRAQQQGQQNQGQQQTQAWVERVRNQLTQHRPKAFREVGLKMSPYTQHLLANELKQMHRFGTELTYDLVLEAAKTAKDVYDADHEQVQQAAKPKTKALPPKRAAAAPSAAPAAANGNGKGGARLSDFDKIMAEQDRRR